MTSSKKQLCRISIFRALIAVIAISPSVLADFNQTSDLYQRLFTGIDTRVHPSVNTSIPKNVYVVLNLLSLRQIVQTEQYFVINAWLAMTWQDEIRSWDPSDYGGVKFVYPGMDSMWRPKVIITNSIGERDVFSDDPAPLTLACDGTARWSPGSVFYLSCPMDMTYFPFDRQKCSIIFLTQEYGTDVNLIPARNPVNTNGYSGHGEWELKSTSARSRVVLYEGVTYSRLVYNFEFKRRSEFYLMNVLVPVILMSLLSPLVFALPEESGERVSFSITLLLSLAVFMGIVAGHLPQSSQPLPIAIVYLFTLLIHCGLCVVFSVLHLKWEQHKKNHREAEMVKTPKQCHQPRPQEQNHQNVPKQNGHVALEDI
ncbi:neuronal acetylcholine receptor subunit alpha-6 [Elysia marginata]|uniref:Neuronal acetylcholine receptor subunit alpha-6 n=1 Tax=Elysia marginata TaxID=1093978 RepID=A0AAV4FS47_9GAST|nr:neuronal acetylcholine receptor subunit alpha-6 [Elysia marginata]